MVKPLIFLLVVYQSAWASLKDCDRTLEALGTGNVRGVLNQIAKKYAEGRVQNLSVNTSHNELLEGLADYFVENGIESRLISDIWDMVIDATHRSQGRVPKIEIDPYGNILALTSISPGRKALLPLSPRALAALYYFYADTISPKHPNLVRENPNILKLIYPIVEQKYREAYEYPYISKHLTDKTVPEMARELSKKLGREISESQIRQVIFAYGLSRLERWNEALDDVITNSQSNQRQGLRDIVHR